MTNVLLCLVMVFAGLAGWISADWYKLRLKVTELERRCPVDSPLKVTIIDDGGADIKVESKEVK